jgi:ATP-dependent DNA helicase PIF1
MSPVFITFSAADIQWHDLHRHFPGFSEVSEANDHVRHKFVWDRVQDQPHLIAHYVAIQRKAFMKYVVAPFLKYEDHWDRDKWQVRGTGHDHGLYWIPDVPPMDQETEGSRSDFAGYWGERITADNPNPLRLPDSRNPASLAPADVANTADQFAAFLNYLQVHICQPRYCLCVKPGSDEPPFCHFFYPRKLFDEPVVTKEINHKSWLFSPVRNQATLNQCSAVITMGWMANTDI